METPIRFYVPIILPLAESTWPADKACKVCEIALRNIILTDAMFPLQKVKYCHPSGLKENKDVWTRGYKLLLEPTHHRFLSILQHRWSTIHVFPKICSMNYSKPGHRGL